MKQEENIRELAIQYFEGRISRADEKNLSEYIEQVEGGYGRFRQWEREWMNHRNRCRYSIDCRYYVGYSTGYLLVYAKDFFCLRSSVGG